MKKTILAAGVVALGLWAMPTMAAHPHGGHGGHGGGGHGWHGDHRGHGEWRGGDWYPFLWDEEVVVGDGSCRHQCYEEYGYVNHACVRACLED